MQEVSKFYISLQIYARVANKQQSILMSSLEKSYIRVLCVDVYCVGGN